MPKKNTEKKTDKRLKNLKKPWKKGDPSPNPSGRPLGQRNYATIYRAALEKLAKAKHMTPEELEEYIEEVGLTKAFQGDYKFFQDFRDRMHGKPVQRNELTGANGKDLIPDGNSKKQTDSVLDSFITKKKK